MKNSCNKEELFSSMPELNQEHIDYINDNIFSHYMTYRHVEKGLDDSGFAELPAGTVCCCSHCEQEIFIKKSRENKEFLKTLKHNNETHCPECKQKVTAKADGYGRAGMYNRYLLAIFIPVNFNTVWARCYDWRIGNYTNIFEPIEKPNECERVLFTPNGAFHWKLEYDYTGYVTGKRGAYWRLLKKPSEALKNLGDFYNYLKYDCVNLESINETFLKYSAYDDYCEIHYSAGIDVSLIKYLEYYCKYPCLEYIVKAGFIKLAASLVEHGKKGKNYLNWNAEKFCDFFKLGKADIKALSVINPDSDTAAEYIKFARRYKEISVEKLHKAIGRYGNVETVNNVLNALECTVTKLFNYLTKTNTPASDYLDYIKQCKELGYSLKSKRVIFPKSFTEAHKHATKALRIIADEEKNKLIRKRKQFLSKFIFENERFIIIIPENAEEIINEGEVLDHCVGRYAEDHANGQTNILFLRYKRRPDKPFYTIEMNNDGTVQQCRGNGNCDKTKKVTMFINEFEKFAKKAAKRKNTKKTKIKITTCA